ncbi:MAG: pyridoxamine 5'-phosphate oxidase [Gemmataceae bacterium]|nr:pyridoxamine 5'-phosphate oxidase [Gemmataceae bacterium]MDW8267279.1 pyridoxamine 5'-phosphate oxidase [Gemmataceae bacterium]
MDWPDLRDDYGRVRLDEADLDPDPVRQLARWLAEAVSAGLPEPNAMALATASPTGRPATRMVLLRGLDDRGLSFFTNYLSRKGRELAANPWAALLFFWPQLARQVRVEGRVEVVSPAESDAYFRTRPRGSQLSAWASPQSEVVSGRDVLEARIQELDRQYAGREVPRPPHWGGYRVVPECFEFWQGGDHRLHDRFRYRRDADGWRIDRLAP